MMIRSLTCELEEVRLEILRKKRGKCCQSYLHSHSAKLVNHKQNDN